MGNRQIANALNISERTAENHLRAIMRTLGVPSRVGVAMWSRTAPTGREWNPS